MVASWLAMASWYIAAGCAASRGGSVVIAASTGGGNGPACAACVRIPAQVMRHIMAPTRKTSKDPAEGLFTPRSLVQPIEIHECAVGKHDLAGAIVALEQLSQAGDH